MKYVSYPHIWVANLTINVDVIIMVFTIELRMSRRAVYNISPQNYEFYIFPNLNKKIKN